MDPVHDTQRVFRVVLEALSRPGMAYAVPVAAADAPRNPWLTSVLLTLLDHETSFAADADRGTEEFVRARTNARVGTAATADFVLTDSDSLVPALIRSLKCGSLAYPDDSATLIVDVLPDADRRSCRVAGPGMYAPHDVHLALMPEQCAALAEVNAQYPCGIDVLLIDAAGDLIGLPRTTRIGGA
jgi:alpha-D-ribose 1-methylphosphonate 5-triphosphate synthase subunit PhnH